MISSSGLNTGHLGSKTRSYCPYMEKSCKHSGGHIFDSIVILLGLDACLGNCSDEFDHESSRMKN
jgi:hypothetical protein